MKNSLDPGDIAKIAEQTTPRAAMREAILQLGYRPHIIAQELAAHAVSLAGPIGALWLAWKERVPGRSMAAFQGYLEQLAAQEIRDHDLERLWRNQ